MRTARAVGRCDIVPIDLDLDVPLTVEEMVDCVSAVATGDDHRRRAEAVDSLGELAARPLPGQRLGLNQVRRDHGRQGEEPVDERLDGRVLQQPGSRAGHHHGVDDERNPMHGEKVRDGVDQLSREEHPRLRRVDADVREDRLELRLDEAGRQLLHGGHAERVLSRERDDRGRPEAARGRERFQVGLDPGSATGIGARNGQTTWNQLPPFAGTNRIRFSGFVLSPVNEAPR